MNRYLEENKLHEIVEESKSFVEEINDELDEIPLRTILEYWMDFIEPKSQKAANEILDKNILPELLDDDYEIKFETYRKISYSSIISKINKTEGLSSEQKKKYIEILKNLNAWLQKISFKTFKAYSTIERVSIHALNAVLTFEEWRTFIETAYKINKRDALIALLLLRTKSRISSILKIHIDQINEKDNSLSFVNDCEVLHFTLCDSLMKKIKDHIENTKNIKMIDDYEFIHSRYMFLTRKGCQVTRNRLNYFFSSVMNACPEIKKNITPDSLRNSWDSLIEGHTEEEIMR